MTLTARYYRVRIHDGTSDEADFLDPATATGNLLSVSSVRGDDAPYIAAPPDGDGTSVDLVTGKATVGEYHVRVIDAETGEADAFVVGDDFSSYADTAAMQAVWGDWSLGTGTRPLMSGKFANAFRPGGGDPWYIERTFTGLTPLASYRVTCVISGFGGLEANGVTDGGTDVTASVTTTSDASGEILVRAGWTADYNGGGNTGIDTIRISEVSANPVGRVVTRVIADAGGDRHLLSRRVALETSEDALTWATMRLGFLNALKLADALVWDLTVGETRRDELGVELFRETPAPAVTPTDYGEVWTTPSLLLGGPVRRGSAYNTIAEDAFGGVSDYGPARYTSVASPGSGTRVLDLSLTGAYLAPLYGSLLTSYGAWEKIILNDHARPFFVPDKTTWYADSGEDWSRFGYFAGLTVRLTRVSDGEVFYTVALAAPARRLNSYPLLTSDDPYGTFDDFTPWTGASVLGVDWDADALGEAKPGTGEVFDVEVWPTVPSAQYPVHEKGHPVALVALQLDAAGVAYDAASATAAVTAINTAHGGAVLDELVWDAALSLEEYHRKILAFHGFALRPNDAGELEFYGLRHAVPDSGQTITLATLREPGSPYDLNESSIVTTAATKTRSFQFARLTKLDDNTRVLDWPLDNLQKNWITLNGSVDPDTPEGKQRTHVWELPGRVLVGGVPQSPREWAMASGEWLVDWKRRGVEVFTFPCLPTITAMVGDLVTVDLPHVPVSVVGESPVTQRGLAPIACRVTQRTETPAGPDLELILAPPSDPGSLAPPTGAAPGEPRITAPVFTLAALAAAPTTYIEIVLTNADDIADEGRVVDFEMELGAVEPTGSGTAIGSINPGTGGVPDSMIAVVPVGSTAWVRATTVGSGVWTMWQSITLGNNPPPAPSLSYDATVLAATGVPDITALLSGSAVAVKLAVGAVDGGPPSATDVRAATADTVDPYGATFPALDPGESVVVGAFAYDVADTESPMALLTVARAAAETDGGVLVGDRAIGDILYVDEVGGVQVLASLPLPSDAATVDYVVSPTATRPVYRRTCLPILSGGLYPDTTLYPSETLYPEDDTGDPCAEWSGGGATALDDLTDVDTTGVADGDVLTYDSATGDWLPAAPTGGGGTLDGLTDVDTTGVADGDVLTYDSGAGEWVATAPTGGGSTAYDPDKPPTSAHALDDEGTGTAGTTASGFTAVNQGASTLTYDGRGRLALMAPTGSDSLRFYHKTPPVGNWTMVAKIRALLHTNFPSVQIAARNSTSGKYFTAGIQGRNPHPYCLTQTWSSSTAFAGESIHRMIGEFQGYFAMTWDGTSLRSYFSPDGLTDFIQYGSASTYVGTPDQIGICANAQSSTVTVYGLFEFWRVIAGTTPPTLGG
jgi:hypothetical protein